MVKVSTAIHVCVLRALETFIGYHQSSPFIRFNFKEIQTLSNSCCSATGFVGQHSLRFDEHSLYEVSVCSVANFSSCVVARKRLKKRPFSMVTTAETDGFAGENNL